MIGATPLGPEKNALSLAEAQIKLQDLLFTWIANRPCWRSKLSFQLICGHLTLHQKPLGVTGLLGSNTVHCTTTSCRLLDREVLKLFNLQCKSNF
jgi:hypothetical protein